MPTQFGYKPSQFGYLTAPRQKPIQAAKPLAQAAATPTSPANPFGLAAAAGGQKTAQFSTPVTDQGTGPAPTTSTTPQLPAAPNPNTQQPVAPTQAGYDINTDPALQQINAYTGMNDEQARAAALRQRSDLALGYGDENIARQVGGDTLAQAAAANPTSQLRQFGQQRDKYLTDLTNFHNQNNTFYGGARILDEQNAATDYQNTLAQAAAQLNQGLGGVDQNLSAALGANQQARIQAMQDAENRALQAALAAQYSSQPGIDLSGLGGGGADTSPAANPSGGQQAGGDANIGETGIPLHVGGTFGAAPGPDIWSNGLAALFAPSRPNAYLSSRNKRG